MRFWDLPCTLIEEIWAAYKEVRDRKANAEAVATAYLAETLDRMLYGFSKATEPYEPVMNRLLPYPKEEEKKELGLLPSPETLDVFFAMLKDGKLPAWQIAHLSPLIKEWKNRV